MNTLKKMFLLTTIAFLLIGFTAVSAEDVETNDVTNDVEYVNENAIVGTSYEPNIEENSLLSSSPEDDIQPGTTTTTAESVMAIAGDYVNLTATVDRVNPGARLSEGNVEFDVNNGYTVVEVPLLDGEATANILIPEEWVNQNITYTASFLGSQSFSPSSDEATITVVREMYDTVTTIDPVIGEFNKPITITATVKTSVDTEVNEGQLYFTTETGDIKDEDGSTIYVDVENSIAKLETITSPSWISEGDTSTIRATYVGHNDLLPSESEPTALRIYDKIYNTTTAMVPPKGLYDQPINFTAAIVTEELKAVDVGSVYFVIGDKVVTDEYGGVLYAFPENGVATVETIANRDWDDEGDVLTIHAVYQGAGEFLDSESEDVALTLVEEYFNTTTTIEPVIGEFNKPITLTANVEASVKGGVDMGEVYFRTDKGAIQDEEGNILYAPVIEGVATLETTAKESWLSDGDVNTIWAVYEGLAEFLPSESNPTALRIYEKIYNTTTTMVPPKGVYGQPITFTATVVDETGKLVETGQVYFVINGETNVTDDEGNVMYADVYDGVAKLDTIAQRSWHNGDVFVINAVYLGVGEFLDSESEYVALTITEPVNPEYKPVKTTKTLKDTNSVKTYKVLVKDNVVATGNTITLKNLNDIFNKDFTNGILIVYLDGKVVFNGTTTDDLTLVILEIIDSLIGEHELKVEFTDSNNETNTYTENITIQ